MQMVPEIFYSVCYDSKHVPSEIVKLHTFQPGGFTWVSAAEKLGVLILPELQKTQTIKFGALS